jgi:general nucleoside transport system permease protein
MTIEVLRGVLAGSILSGTSLLYAALGELVGEKAGVVNLGVEGVMLTGAAVAAAIAWLTGNPYLGVLAAALAGSAINLLFAYVAVGRRANQLAAGLALMFLGMGASALIGQPFVGASIAGLPKLGRGGDLLVYLALPTAALIWGLLFRTRWGLGLRAVGENPQAAFAAGRRPERLRYQALLLAGALGGVGGAHLAVALTLGWTEGMTAGRGFIAIALVIFANWNPLWLVAGALLFGAAETLELALQAQGVDISPFLMSMIPYLLTLVVLPLWIWRGRSAAPAALGRTYRGAE